MKQDGTRLENKTPREIMNMDEKLSSNDCSKGYVAEIKLNDVSTPKVKHCLACRTTNQQSFVNKSHEYSPLWRITSPFIPLCMLIFSFVLHLEKFHSIGKNSTFRRAGSE